MRTLGIDLAAQAPNTGVCTVDWAGDPLVAFPADAGDDDLLAAIGDADKVGVDVPFGWPTAFTDAVRRHGRAEPWPVVPADTPARRRGLCYRRTDRAVADRVGRRPLSVSSDRIGVAAMRMAGLEQACRDRGLTTDRTGTEGVLCETYPAATLVVWDLPATGYKGAAGAAERREEIVGHLADRTGLRRGELTPAVDSDDRLDALICAVVARAAALGRTVAPSGDEREVAAVEGWIHLPVDGDPATAVA